MKLISLNVWGGTKYEALAAFLKEHSVTTDIFCLQEVFSAPESAPLVSSGARMRLFEELGNLLENFSGFFIYRSSGFDFSGPVNFSACHGMAVFVKRQVNLEVTAVNGRLISKTEDSIDKLLWLKLYL